jgi:hypothetical protein
VKKKIHRIKDLDGVPKRLLRKGRAKEISGKQNKIYGVFPIERKIPLV